MNSPEAVKQTLASHGMTIREWAAVRGFSESLVYAVLSGKNKASRGESFRIAVALGLRQEPPASKAPTYVTEVLASRGSLYADQRSREGRMT
jgi:gp16 family phage-associated protein